MPDVTKETEGGLDLVGFAGGQELLGMIIGSILTVAQTSGAYAVVLIPTIFGGAWFDLESVGGVFRSSGVVIVAVVMFRRRMLE